MARDARPVDEILLHSPNLVEGLADYGGTWMLLSGGVLNIYGNIGREDAERIGANANLGLVQFSRKFSVSTTTLALLNDHVLARHPATSIRTTLNGHGAFDDLRFLNHLPGLRSLSFAGNWAVDLEPVRRHDAIEDLGVGGIGTSLRPLEGRHQLKAFGWSERPKHTETIATFRNLQRLDIGSQSLKSLAFLSVLPRLRSLSFMLGGTRNFADLVDFPALEDLVIWRTRKLEAKDLLPVNEISGLKHFMLAELPRITSLDWLTNPTLQWLELERMRGLQSLTSLEDLPGLETLVLSGTFSFENIAELCRLPKLKTLYVHEYPLKKLKPAVDTDALPFAIRIIDFVPGQFPSRDAPSA